MEFEKKVPVWSAEGTEPPESLKKSGFQGGYRPPAPYFNWFWNRVGACLTELQEILNSENLPEDIGAAKADLSNVTAETLKEAVSAAGGGGGIPIVAAASTDGVAYTATLEGVTELTNGMLVTIIPEITSTSTAITLNINGLGAKMVRLPLSFNNAAMASPKLETYYTAGRPLTLQYDAAYLADDGIWKVYGKQKTSAQDLYGYVPVESGGTGAETAEAARANLGAAAKSQAVALTVAASAWTGAGPYSATVACTLATASNNLVVGAGGALTAEQMEAMVAAVIVCTAQAAGSITLTAFGDVPEIDLPVNVLEVG